MNHLLDTLSNIGAFAFIGLLIWLYFKPVAPDDGDGSKEKGPSSR